MKILLIAGARPNYMKIAPLIHELQKNGGEIEWQLVDTGQHYDYELSKIFFKEFDIPKPGHFLNVGSASHSVQTAKIMVEFEKVCQKENPDLVVVVGDVNSTLACSVTARKMGIKVAHVEAGLRSFDRTMPEEINRIVTDSISDYLFVSEKSGMENLRREGIGYTVDGKRCTEKSNISKAKVFFVGNIMIDTLYYSLAKLNKTPKTGMARHNHAEKYAVLTLHRPANVDEKEKLMDILGAVIEISKDIPVYFPCHPRTAKSIKIFKLKTWLKKTNIKILPPQSYLDFLALWKDAALVLTDSGGIQEETTVLGIPCFTIRDNTERPITIEEGTNILVGTRGSGILKAYLEFRNGKIKKGKVPELWDGRTAERIVSALIGI